VLGKIALIVLGCVRLCLVCYVGILCLCSSRGGGALCVSLSKWCGLKHRVHFILWR
jgi:hypothetical protein